MKKYLIWIGAAILVMALASPSMAQFKSWGHLEVESYWTQNFQLNKDLNTANYQGIGMRYRFNLGYGDPKTVMAVLGFEANSRGFGEGPSDSGAQVVPTSSFPLGQQPVAGGATQISMAGKTGAGAWGTDTIGVYVRHYYFDFTIPNTPLTMTVGARNITIGGFLGRFFVNKDIPSIVLNGNFAPHTISAMYWKGLKQNYFMDNDLDFYGLVYNLKQQMFNVEAWFLYSNDRRSVQDTITLVRSGTAGQQYPPIPAPVGPSAGPYTFTVTETITAKGYEQKPWWLGANVPITLGNWKFEPTFVYVGGKFTDALNSSVATAPTKTADISAYLADLTVSYRLGPGLKFLVEGFYATGHDGTKNTFAGDTESQFMFPAVSSGVGQGNVASLGTENRNVFGNGWSVFYYWNTELSYYNGRQLDVSGTAFVRPNVEFNPTPWLNLNFNYLYIMNTANKYNGHISGITPAGPTGTDVNKSYIGSEINGIAKIAIYKDFQYAVGFGYFFPGDVYDTPSKTADQGWSLLSNLRYVF